MSIPSDKIPSDDQARWAHLVADYFDKIEPSEGEFTAVSREILRVFPYQQEGNFEDISNRIAAIQQSVDLCSTTKISLQERLGSIAELIKDSHLWTFQGQSKAFVSFIVDNIRHRATQWAHFTSQEERAYLHDHQKRTALALRDQQALGQAKPVSAVGSKMLDEDQQFEANELWRSLEEFELTGFRNFSIPIEEDLELVAKLIDADYLWILEKTPTLFKNSSSEIAKLLLNKDLIEFEVLSLDLRNSEEVAKVGLEFCSSDVLEHLGADLKLNREFWLSAIQIQASSILRVPGELRFNYLFLRSVLEVNKNALDYIKMQPDYILKKFYKDSGPDSKSYIQILPFLLLGSLSDNTLLVEKTIREFLHNVLEINPLAVKSLLKDDCDQDFLVESIGRNVYVMLFLPDELLRNREFLLNCIQANPFATRFIDESFLSDRGFALDVLRRRPELRGYLPKNLTENPEFLEEIKLIAPANFEDHMIIPIEFGKNYYKNFKDLIEMSKLMNFIIRELPIDKTQNRDPRAILLATGFCHHRLMIFPSPFCDEKEFLLKAVKKNPFAVMSVITSEALLLDQSFLLKLVHMNPATLNLLPESIHLNKDFLLQAISRNRLTLSHIPDELRIDVDFLEKVRSMFPDVVQDLEHLLKPRADFCMLPINYNMCMKFENIDMEHPEDESFHELYDLKRAIHLMSIFDHGANS